MLNKALFLFTLVLGLSLNSTASNADMNYTKIKDKITIIPHLVEIKEPFISLATVILDIENKTSSDLKIKSITSPEAHYSGVFSKKKNEIGAFQVKREKDVFIKANATTAFADGKLIILLTGLKRKYNNFEEIPITIDFETLGKVKTHVPVDVKYD